MSRLSHLAGVAQLAVFVDLVAPQAEVSGGSNVGGLNLTPSMAGNLAAFLCGGLGKVIK